MILRKFNTKRELREQVGIILFILAFKTAQIEHVSSEIRINEFSPNESYDFNSTRYSHHNLQVQNTPKDTQTSTSSIDEHPVESEDRRIFVRDFLRILHEQYGSSMEATNEGGSANFMEERQSYGRLGFGPQMMHRLLDALESDGDMRRLIDWVKNSFNPASIPELTTQFVVSKLGSINCPAILRPDKEETLVPRFLLFNEYFVDVPFELTINPTTDECLKNGKFDPKRKTVVLIHGYLAGYTLVDGITNIKNRLLDLNRVASEQAISMFERDADYHQGRNSSFIYTDDLSSKISEQMYNVIIVDWFNGANPTPRSNYIRAAVNAQVVGQLIARFLSSLIVQCQTPANQIQIIAHSLGCHVSGFTGKSMNAAGHKLGKITHLDPVGLCFGPLFSQPKFRLSPDDALDTQAVHTSLNIFDNPLDGVHSNFLLNGGRDQTGCGGPSELKNSTTSSVALMFDPAAKFAPCSHMKALALFEDDHSTNPGQCQMVGYRCQDYDRFLAGKCGFCDSTNGQCRLMSLDQISMQFNKLTLSTHRKETKKAYPGPHYDIQESNVMNKSIGQQFGPKVVKVAIRANPSATRSKSGPSSYITLLREDNEDSTEESDSRQTRDDERPVSKRERIVHVIEKLKNRKGLVNGWSSLLASQSSLKENSQATSKINFENIENKKGQPTMTTKTVRPSLSTTQTQVATAEIGMQVTSEIETSTTEASLNQSMNRNQQDPKDHIPIGSQRIPAGSLHGPLFFLGTGALSPFCVNYYQFRVLIAERRLHRILKSNGLGSNRLAPQMSQRNLGSMVSSASNLQHRVANASGRDMVHLTVKLSDTAGRFFKGFSMLENARSLNRVMDDFKSLESPFLSGGRQAMRLSEPMVELTMLLNTTSPEPRRIGETLLSFYFHQIVLADRIEVNYMSNISPEIRSKYSSVLCPVAINDQHQLVKYVECEKILSVISK